MYKNSALNRRKIKIRKKIAKQNTCRLSVYKSNKHIYAQLFNSKGSFVILSASSIDKDFKNEVKDNHMTKIDQAFLVGSLLAKKIKDKGIDRVVFDRSGFKFHGRIKAVANAILNNGIFC